MSQTLGDLFFDTPWWIIFLIIVVGGLLFYTGMVRRENRATTAGLVTTITAVFLALLSHFVDTPKEHVTDRTRALVEAISRKNWDSAKAMLDQRTTFAGYASRDEIITAAQIAADQIGLVSARVTGMQLEQTESLITLVVNCVSYQKITLERPLPSTWQMDWQETADGWSLSSITLLKVGNEPGADIVRRLPDPQR